MKRNKWCKYLYWWVLQRSDKQDKWWDVVVRRTRESVQQRRKLLGPGCYRIVKRRRLNPKHDGHDETRPYEGRKGRIVGAKRPV